MSTQHTVSYFAMQDMVETARKDGKGEAVAPNEMIATNATIFYNICLKTDMFIAWPIFRLGKVIEA
ncbi:MAG: hypothetical protein OXG15_17115 [Gammaproteobacteria bacterium]|nr:hypothetical protein [Gammaproteobacteria bacterium]